MQRFDVQIALEGVRESKGEWAKAVTKFNRDIDYIMNRLLNEAAINFMSAEDVAKYSGFTVKRIRTMMRAAGLNPKEGKRLLSQKAATALAENAELLGVQPHEVDLMSPLAYLPMGSQMKRELRDKSVSQVHEVSGNEDEKIERLTEVFKEAWHSRDAYWRTAEGTGAESESDRTQAGIRAVLAALA